MSVLSLAPRPSAGFAVSEAGADPTAVALAWAATNDLTFTQYSVLQSLNGSGGPYTSVAVITSQSTTSYVDTGLTPSSTSWWEVSESGWLSGTQTTVPINVTQPALADLNYTTPTSTSAWFNWTNNATYGGPLGFVSYVLYEQVGSAPASPVATITDVANRTDLVTGLTPATSYLFHVVTTDCYVGCGGTGPTTTTTQSNVVSLGTPLPLAVSLTDTRTVVDVGQADLFLCTPSGGKSPFTYTWNFGNGTYVPLPPSASHAFASSGTATVSCRVTDSTPTQASSAVSVSVNPAPNVTVQLNRTSVDVGQSISFGCSPVNGTTPYSVVWAFGDGSQSSGGFLTHAYSTAGSLAATCTATDATGTTVTATQRVVVSPAPSMTVTVNSAYAAPGTALTFKAVPSNGTGSFSGPSWTFGDGSGGTGTPRTHAFSAGNFTATASSTDGNGATASASVTVHITAISVTVGALPASVPLGTLVNYSATASGGAGAPYNFTWTFPNGSVAYGAAVSAQYGASPSLVATVEVRDVLGASHNVTTTPVAVVPPPGPPPSYTLWYVLALIVVLLLVAGLLAVVIRRRRRDRALAGQLGRIPPTDPREVTRAKICPACGASNRGLRGTCANCGAPL